jgi:ribosomal protein L37AE/L43A
MTERATPFYCPYCGGEDLRPSEKSNGAWECRGCTRVFSLKFIGLGVRS